MSVYACMYVCIYVRIRHWLLVLAVVLFCLSVVKHLNAHVVTCVCMRAAAAEQYLQEVAHSIDAFFNALPEKVYRGVGKEGITIVMAQVH
jgi:hypothetical protein